MGTNGGVGMEVFRDSLQPDSDMGKHLGLNKAWPPLIDFTGLEGEKEGMKKRRVGAGLRKTQVFIP